MGRFVLEQISSNIYPCNLYFIKISWKNFACFYAIFLNESKQKQTNQICRSENWMKIEYRIQHLKCWQMKMKITLHCGFVHHKRTGKAHKSSTIEIVNSGILSDRLVMPIQLLLYVDEFLCTRMFLFSGPLFFVYAYWTIADSEISMRVLNDVWFFFVQSRLHAHANQNR